MIKVSKPAFQDVATLLGGSLRRWREQQGLPLRAVADRLGVTCATISCWESGKRFPSGRHIDAIAALTGMHPHQLFTDAGATNAGRPRRPAVPASRRSTSG